ncbi:hypothetical protein AAFC00_005806 [Neodothiora populina]|uniref:Flavin-nucleotide-binding protein n=1 Tax=Neodothiora populina TaxID=2781224 RepID=A0ABR3P5X5_9PEZI
MATQGEYAKTKINAVNRYRGRGKYDHETIHALVNSVPVLHVSFNVPLPDDDDESGISYPTILPMIGCMSNYRSPGSISAPQADNDNDNSDEPPVLYLHGYISSRLIKQGGTNTGLPMSIAATSLDGLVLALTPNHHSCNYRSAVLFGRATLVSDESERMRAMQLITENMLPNRWNNSRVPPTKVEMQSTGILRVEIDAASAKTRTGGPGEDRADLKDEALRERVWTGVVPVSLQWGEPVPAEGNRVDKVPGYVEEWRVGSNAEAVKASTDSAS